MRGKDLTGEKFGKLTVTGISHRDARSHIYWKCQCECGNEKIVHYGNLNSGRSQSCGCARSAPTHNLTGKTFGRWTVIEFSHRDDASNPYWDAICSCGTTRKVEGSTLFSGKSKSCGCGHLDSVTTHRGSYSKAYGVWSGMIQRCHNENDKSYSRYGGRGIKVCHRWRNSFSAFLVDMGESPNGMSIERKNNDEGYSPGNCKWATSKEQQRNTRRNKVITFNGKTQTLIEWSEELGINNRTLCSRIRKNWPLEKALSPHVRKRRGA